MRVLQLTAALILSSAAASAQSQLSVSGQPYFGGSVTLSVASPTDAGKPVLLAYGLNPLPLWAPLSSKFGPFYIGQMFNVLGLGSIGVNGRYDLPIGMPAYNPVLEGISVALQAYIAGTASLTNPTTLPLDKPYFDAAHTVTVTSPQPSLGALFGDQLAIGDLNADGFNDLVVGAWFEDYAGIEKSGRVYVLWGPSFSSYVTLQPTNPIGYGLYGASATVADMNDDGVDDLIVAETPGDPAIPTEAAQLNIFLGGTPFVPAPAKTVASPGTGAAYNIFGRILVVGDYNGDGNQDIAVGNPETVNGFADVGRIYVYFGSSFASYQVIENPEPAASDFFGSALRTADIDGNGMDDLVEGSGRDDLGGVVNAGSVHVFAGPALSLIKTIYNPLPQGFNSRFGEQVHAADLNDDGKDEVIAADQKNRVYIFWSPGFTSYSAIRKPALLDTENPASISFGYFIGSGDINGDGILDVLVSDVFEGGMTGCAPLGREGTLFTALGPYYSVFDVLRNPMAACGDDFSFNVRVMDLNKDGLPDVITSSDTADANGLQNSGRVFVILGHR